MPDIREVIAAVAPDYYYDTKASMKYEKKKELDQLKRLVKEKGVSAAIKEMKEERGQFKTKEDAKHILVYDSAAEGLEPVYFWFIDFMNELKMSPEKIVDNFVSSPGSGHFGELQSRASIMQQQGSKILADVGILTKSILSIVYDLKEFKIRLQSYDDARSSNKDLKEGALHSLKQIWLDKVDILKGTTSIKQLSFGQAGFQTLLDAFLIAEDESLKIPGGDEMDLNERVKRIVKSRIVEFNIWLKQSEYELRKRYNLERTYLKSQVNSLKLYTRWARPYLKAASEMEMAPFGKNPALVKVFNTILLQLIILGKVELKPMDEVRDSNFPKELANERMLKKFRKYYSCQLVEFNFRGIPQRVGQQGHYAFGGRVEVSFSAFSLNEEELKKINKELDNSDLNDALSLVEGATSGSLEQLQKEIDEFLEDKPEDRINDENKDTSNPFLAILGYYEKPSSGNKKDKEKEKKKEKELTVASESFVEKEILRKVAKDKAVKNALTLFETYKKSHGMVAFP